MLKTTEPSNDSVLSVEEADGALPSSLADAVTRALGRVGSAVAALLPTAAAAAAPAAATATDAANTTNISAAAVTSAAPSVLFEWHHNHSSQQIGGGSSSSSSSAGNTVSYAPVLHGLWPCCVVDLSLIHI